MSVRDWLQHNFEGSRRSDSWIDLWTAASGTDFKLDEAYARGGEAGRTDQLATDDCLELWLRRLASYVYVSKSGDKVGGARMLAVNPPGSGVDLAPDWLVTEATAHSAAEFKRVERVTKLAGGRGGIKGSPKGGGRGDPKGKAARSRGGGAKGSPARPPQTPH